MYYDAVNALFVCLKPQTPIGPSSHSHVHAKAIELLEDAMVIAL
jgi:hypothetical protein